MRPRLIEGPTRSLLVVFNDTAEDQTASVKLPARYRRATDLYGKQEVTIQGSTVRINVPFEGASVLRLE